MLEELKKNFQRFLGCLKKSTFFNALVAAMAFLPLLDIGTDYVFIYITLMNSDTGIEKTVLKTCAIMNTMYY